MSSHSDRPTNRLAGETSPYLLQHRHNPVDWYPWGDEALARARSEGKPIFLSIGYSACHWCHVMERESFESDEVAAFLREHYIAIKVDREERPDLDDVYMKATQVLSGHGGWPMSVFLTPNLQPFYAGTYFPPGPRHGMPAFMQVLAQLANAWETRQDEVIEQAGKVTERVQQLTLTAEHLPALGPVVERPRLDLVEAAVAQLTGLYDNRHGGFGGPPKFPHADDVRLLLRQHLATGDPAVLEMAEHTLDCMARGGIYDQLAGGFSRYSVDGEWAVPHFEKMLYDNALLVGAYLEAHRVTGRADFARVARECCDWVLSEMVDPEGGLWSTQDADSEGEEGRFYVWQRDEVLKLVGRQHKQLVDAYWGFGESENFEGHAWVLRRYKTDAATAAELGLTVDELDAAIAPLRATLLEARAARVRPATDDKVLVSWNGLMIAALARAGAVLDEPRFTAAAARAADFCLTSLRPDGRRLLATWRGGKAHLNATLADYAYLADGLLELFEASGEARWLSEARSLTDVAREHFGDRERAGFFFTSDDHEQLVARPRDLYDGALPSSNGVMADVLVRLGALTGDATYSDEADRLFAQVEPIVRSSPVAFGRLLLALLRASDGARAAVVTGGEGAHAMTTALRTSNDPGLSVLPVPAEGVDPTTAERFPLLAEKSAQGGRATVYVCRTGTCSAPVSDPAGLAAVLSR